MKLKYKIQVVAAAFLLFCIVFYCVLEDKDSINNSKPFKVNNKSQIVLPQRMSQYEMCSIDAPYLGMLVYCEDCKIKGLYMFNGLVWFNFIASSADSRKK